MMLTAQTRKGMSLSLLQLSKISKTQIRLVLSHKTANLLMMLLNNDIIFICFNYNLLTLQILINQLFDNLLF